MADIPRLPTFSTSHLQSRSQPRPPRPQSSGVDSATTEPKSRRRSLPFVFSPLLPKNTSSTSLVPSTAEGRPVPLDNSTAAHRTTALRQLNRSQPSTRHYYTRSSETPSIKSTTTETYSQPVVVRTYSGAPPSSSAKGPVSVSTAPPPSNPATNHPNRNGTVIGMMRYKGNDKPRFPADAKLPPLEAFSFKSIMADIQQDVGADLDRIAEICARSKYSLSNQYEVHIAPQGSGSGFVGPSTVSSRPFVQTGPTLQAISSDDEQVGPMPKKRRGIARRRSVAYGTLETIMSSSRSSDEDKCRKKPAAQIIAEVRGRATKNENTEGASEDSTEAQASTEQQEEQRGHLSRKQALFATAIIDSSRKQMRSEGNIPHSRTSGVVLLGGPAKPQMSRNHLQTRTSPERSSIRYIHESRPRPSRALAESVASATITTPEEPRAPITLTTWMPWKGVCTLEMTASKSDRVRCYSSYAEGSLRELLRSKKALTSGDKSVNVS
ncbi:hypothetical protein F4820DRAFT_182745 [Hypoxylon rubiginosum]|uniref:Uncharacterized protein n=1 Tax=Hypoxylon rubiginosum TaxID=110542 RepID=A0ACB9YI90_9PEZI|nr:hypothetical protein F4820DRAFT_182745 [Hypoxylon rubiginosum]